MKLIIMLMMLLMCVVLVNGFQVDTMSYSVEKTNIGLAGSDLDTSSYGGRFYFEPFYPASLGETGFFNFHTGYFQATNPAFITNVTFSPVAPSAYLNTTLSAIISGGFSEVIVGVFTNHTGWINYTLNYTGPNTYSYTVDGVDLIFGETFSQEWFVKDNNYLWVSSGVYSVVVGERILGATTLDNGRGNQTGVEEPKVVSSKEKNLLMILLVGVLIYFLFFSKKDEERNYYG